MRYSLLYWSYMVSQPYSRYNNWRYRVVDLHISVNGPQYYLKDLLSGSHHYLLGLTVELYTPSNVYGRQNIY